MFDLNRVSSELEQRPASQITRWAWEVFGDGAVLSASFQDCVLIAIAAEVAPRLSVVFLDTQYHFEETLQYVEHVRERFDIDLKVVEPLAPRDDRWRYDQNSCCRVRKVEPLRRALEGKTAWLTGLRRAESSTRAGAAVVAWDDQQQVVKINPLAAWSDADVDRYIADHDLPVHPLTHRGYTSIGCWPCTRPVSPDEDPRAGRWSDSEKTECGLHGDSSPGGVEIRRRDALAVPDAPRLLHLRSD